MPISRTGNFRGVNSNGEFKTGSVGTSDNDVEKDIRTQQYNQRNPHQDYDNWERLHQGQESMGNRYALTRNTTQYTSTLPEFKAEHAKELLVDRLSRGGKHRRRPSSRKYKKSAKRVFRKKSRYTRRR
jgi:hypothetical protein